MEEQAQEIAAASMNPNSISDLNSQQLEFLEKRAEQDFIILSFKQTQSSTRRFPTDIFIMRPSERDAGIFNDVQVAVFAQPIGKEEDFRFKIANSTSPRVDVFLKLLVPGFKVIITRVFNSSVILKETNAVSKLRDVPEAIRNIILNPKSFHATLKTSLTEEEKIKVAENDGFTPSAARTFLKSFNESQLIAVLNSVAGKNTITLIQGPPVEFGKLGFGFDSI